MSLGAQITGLLSCFFLFYYYTAKLVNPNIHSYNSKSFTNLSIMYFIFGAMAGVIGILLSLFIKFTLWSKNYVEIDFGQLVSISCTYHVICMVFFFSLFMSGFAYMTLSFSLTKSQSKYLFFEVGKLSSWLVIFSFFIFCIVLFLDFKSANHFWAVQVPYSGYLVRKEGLLGISMIFFIVSHLILAINFIRVMTTYKRKFTNLPIFMLTLLLASILLVSVLPIVPLVVIMSYFIETSNSFFSNSITNNIHDPLANFVWITISSTIFQLTLLSMGIISHIVLKVSKNYKLNKKYFIWNLSYISILGYFYWLIIVSDVYFNFSIEVLASKLRIILPLAIFLLLVGWCFCLYGSKIKLETTVLFAVGYIVTMFFALCILFLLALVNLELTYSEIEILFYYVFVNVVSFAFFGGFYLCFNKIFRCYYSEFLGILHFWFFFVGSNLNCFPSFFTKMSIFHTCNLNSSWQEFVHILDYAEELGGGILAVSFFLFIFIIIEALVKKRTNKDSILNLSKFDIKSATNKLDFLITICFLVYSLLVFVLCFINQIYWVLMLYGALFLVVVFFTMSPTVTNYIDPLRKKSTELNSNYKDNWPFLYYFIQFVKFFFLGLNLYIIFFLDISFETFCNSPDIASNILRIELEMTQFETSTLMIIYKVLSPIFFISLGTDMYIKLYELRLLFFAEHSAKTR